MRSVAAGIPVFCEKPVAPDIPGTLDVLARVAGSGVPVQVGFQRRFDAGFAAARAAVLDGRLGSIHSVVAATLDPAPPPAAYVAISGGIFRDCSVHDFDIVRWVTGREVVSVYAVGANHGADYIREAGDVDAVAALLTLDDGCFVHVTASRYNAAGYDVRMEVRGSADSVSVGLDDRTPLRPADPAVPAPAGAAYPGFLDRFRAAYAAELAAFVDLVARPRPEPVHGLRRLGRVPHRRGLRPLPARGATRCTDRRERLERARNERAKQANLWRHAVPARRRGPGMRRPWDRRLAGAPISWGVCEVPGWGHQLPAEQVLTEMAGAGLRATEFGPDGFLPAEANDRRRMLDRYGLTAVGGFVPVVLHESGRDPLAELDGLFASFAAVGAGVVVLAAVSGADGYEARPVLDRAAWRTVCANLGRIAAVAESYGLLATLHPHVGTVVERYEEVARVLDGCMIPLCLDTGHLLVGGADPLQLAREAAGRVAHVHLKDVDARWAERVRAGEVGYADAVRAGLYRPLGLGDADVAAVVAALEAGGYDGWYVLEQDRVLDTGADAGGVTADIATGLANLAAALEERAA